MYQGSASVHHFVVDSLIHILLTSEMYVHVHGKQENRTLSEKMVPHLYNLNVTLHLYRYNACPFNAHDLLCTTHLLPHHSLFGKIYL